MRTKESKFARHIGGHAFKLKNYAVCEELSDETLLFEGELWCDGVLIGHFNNDGRGGSTGSYIQCDKQWLQPITEAISKVLQYPEDKFLGDLGYDLESIADELAYLSLDLDTAKLKKLSKTHLIYINPSHKLFSRPVRENQEQTNQLINYIEANGGDVVNKELHYSK